MAFLTAIPEIAATVARLGTTAARVGAKAASTGAKAGVEIGARNAAAQMTYGAISHVAGPKKTPPDEDQAYK